MSFHDNEPFRADSVFVARSSEMSPSDAVALLGKTVSGIDAQESSLEIRFTDGSRIELRADLDSPLCVEAEIKGGRWG